MFERPQTQKQQAQAQDHAITGYIGIQRRIYRELRAGLLEEGVPPDLVDEATVAFIKHMAASIEYSREKK
ncbi:hypothetical protein [Corynebacterium callunae]|uniref:hypothetical protein n=1 Tax=Corynebacterium callunae TaxID=1721 RepID=UPI001FFF1EDD|nr:hypothetical protein [Corynebacterium callunae]MCK2200198.1 hypothetical protein [Corynebacterium callunae]